MHAIQKDHLHDTWETKPEMIGPRTGATVVLYRDIIVSQGLVDWRFATF